MWKNILETYRCIVTAKRNMPGARIEHIFGSCTQAELDAEYEWLKEKAEQEGYKDDLRTNVENCCQKVQSIVLQLNLLQL